VYRCISCRECQLEDRASHKELCNRVLKGNHDFLFDHVLNETDILTNTEPSSDVVDTAAVDVDYVLHELRNAGSSEAALHWLHVLARCPGSDVLASNSFSVVVDVMEKFGEETAVLKRACALFCVLTLVDIGTAEIEKVAASMAKAGGTDTILAAMEKHPDDVCSIGCATSALLSLTFKPDNVDAVNAVKILGAVVQAMKRFPDDMGVQKGGWGIVEPFAWFFIN